MCAQVLFQDILGFLNMEQSVCSTRAVFHTGFKVPEETSNMLEEAELTTTNSTSAHTEAHTVIDAALGGNTLAPVHDAHFTNEFTVRAAEQQHRDRTGKITTERKTRDSGLNVRLWIQDLDTGSLDRLSVQTVQSLIL